MQISRCRLLCYTDARKGSCYWMREENLHGKGVKSVRKKGTDKQIGDFHAIYVKLLQVMVTQSHTFNWKYREHAYLEIYTKKKMLGW